MRKSGGEIAGILVLGIRMDAFVNRLRPFIELDEKIYVFCKEGHFYLEITSGSVQIESLSSYPDVIPENQIIVKKLGFASYLEKIKLLLGVAIFMLSYFFLIVFYKKKIVHKTIIAPLERALKIESKTSFFGYYFSIDALQKMLFNAENIFSGFEKMKKIHTESMDSCSALVRFYERGVYQFYKKILLMRSKALLLKNKSEHDKDISDFIHEMSILDLSNLDFVRSDFCLFDLIQDVFLTIRPFSEKNGLSISFSKDRGIDKKIFHGCHYYYAYLLRCILHYIMEIMISKGKISIDLAHYGKNDAIIFVNYSGVVADEKLYSSLVEISSNHALCIYSFAADIVERGKELSIRIEHDDFGGENKCFKIYVHNESKKEAVEAKIISFPHNNV